MIKDKWIISIDRPVNEGTIDVTDLMSKLRDQKHQESLFRWIAQYHNASCALLLVVSGVTGSILIKAEYFAPTSA